jgi:cyclophilin family peptidyl-prolyl cis-trans isomerase
MQAQSAGGGRGEIAMKNQSILAFAVSAFFLFSVLACTPPPKQPAEDRGEEEEKQVQETQETEEPEGAETMFGHYTEWPPESITDEEVELLKNVVCVLETSKGVIKIKLFPDVTPIHSANFVKLIPAEIGTPHDVGRIASAMRPNAANATSGSQFYLVHTKERTQHLDRDFTVFGEIVEGQNVNLLLTVTYDADNNLIPGAVPDTIVRAYIETAE